MNLVRPAGAFPGRPFSINLEFGRTALFASVGVLSALNAEAGQIISALQYQPLQTFVANLAGVSAVAWFAMYAALKIGFEADSTRASSRADKFALAVAVLLAVVPIFYAAKAALLLTGAYLLATSRRGSDARRVSYVLLALTGPLIWGRLILLGLAEPLLSLDAHIVGGLIGSPVDGNTVRFAGSGTQFLVGVGCSSVHNMSLAIVLWTTAAALFSVRPDWRFVAFGAAMVVWMFTLNILRLASIGLFPARFEFLHDGAGAELFGWVGLLGAASLAAIAVINASRRQQ